MRSCDVVCSDFGVATTGQLVSRCWAMGLRDHKRTRLAVGPGPVPKPARHGGQTLYFAGASSPSTDADADTGAQNAPARLQPGQRVADTRYRIRRFIGDGGMGEVYEAEHMDLGRPVALKILLREHSDSPRAVELFRSEARAASKVGADEIVQLFDFAELPDGRLMYTMELLEGPTLAEEIGAAPLRPGRIVAILRQVCAGLAAAHQAGVIHRDIKPDNIVLDRRRRIEQVKILDFGIATMLEEPHAASAVAAGTPMYIAPELVARSSFGHRVAIYGLGCTAYEMCTGRPPFVARDGESIAELLQRHIEERPQPFAAVSDAPRMPACLEAVVMHCLAKAPEDRFKDMEALEVALCDVQIQLAMGESWDATSSERGAFFDLDLDFEEPVPAPRAQPRRSRVWTLASVASVSLAMGVGAALLSSDAPADPPLVVAGTPDIEAITPLVEAARAAAGASAFVYPPSDAPRQPTAYTKVVELEALGHPKAAEIAAELRSEFAASLVDLGDAYWSLEQGRIPALHYYRQALLFERNNARAKRRADAAAEDLDALHRQASTLGFSPEEIAAAQPLVSLAQRSKKRRRAKLAAARVKRKAAREHEDGGGATIDPSDDDAATEALLALAASPPPARRGTADDAPASDPAASRPDELERPRVRGGGETRTQPPAPK